MPDKIPEFSFRPVALAEGESDLPFLCDLYASTRQEELAQTGWSQGQIDDFLRQQFEAQHKHYMEHFGSAEFDLILGGDGAPIGRFYLDEWDREFRIIDIALRPESRGRGIGGAILRDLVERAFALGKAVSIHVESYNPAMRLYERLGFRKVEDQGVYHLMELSPPGTAEESAA